MQLSGVKSFFGMIFGRKVESDNNGETPKFLLVESVGVYNRAYYLAVLSSEVAANRAIEQAHDMRTALSQKPRPSGGYEAGHRYMTESSEMDDDIRRLDNIAASLESQPRFVPEGFSFDSGDHTKLPTARQYAEKEARQWERKKIFWEGELLKEKESMFDGGITKLATKRVLLRYRGIFYVALVVTEKKNFKCIRWMTTSASSMNKEELRLITDIVNKE